RAVRGAGLPRRLRDRADAQWKTAHQDSPDRDGGQLGLPAGRRRPGGRADSEGRVAVCHCEPPTVFCLVWRTAHKPHRCCECTRTIAPGERYAESSGIWDGTPDRFRRCESCERIVEEVCRLLVQWDDCGPCFGELEEFIHYR